MKSPFIGFFSILEKGVLNNHTRVGSKVKKGSVLCYIQSLGLVHEIKSKYDGEIVKMPLSNGDTVGFGTVLFEIKENYSNHTKLIVCK